MSITEFAPQSADFLPVLLQRTNEESHPADLHPKGEALFDVAAYKRGGVFFELQYAPKHLPRAIEARRYELTLLVEGENAPKLEKTVVLDRTSDGDLLLTALDPRLVL